MPRHHLGPRCQSSHIKVPDGTRTAPKIMPHRPQHPIMYTLATTIPNTKHRPRKPALKVADILHLEDYHHTPTCIATQTGVTTTVCCYHRSGHIEWHQGHITCPRAVSTTRSPITKPHQEIFPRCETTPGEAQICQQGFQSNQGNATYVSPK